MDSQSPAGPTIAIPDLRGFPFICICQSLVMERPPARGAHRRSGSLNQSHLVFVEMVTFGWCRIAGADIFVCGSASRVCPILVGFLCWVGTIFFRPLRLMVRRNWTRCSPILVWLIPSLFGCRSAVFVEAVIVGCGVIFACPVLLRSAALRRASSIFRLGRVGLLTNVFLVGRGIETACRTQGLAVAADRCVV